MKIRWVGNKEDNIKKEHNIVEGGEGGGEEYKGPEDDK
jgi:hypothetical protein